MNMHRQGGAYQGALLTLVAVALPCLLFGWQAYDQYTIAQGLLKGDAEAEEEDLKPENSLYTRRDAMRGAEKRVDAALRGSIEPRVATIASLDVQLAARGVVMNAENKVVVGEATDDFTPWEQVNTQVEHIAKRQQATAEGVKHRMDRKFPEMKALIDSLRTQLNTVVQEATKRDDEFEKKKNELLERLDKLEAKDKKNEEEYQANYSTKATRKTQLDAKIRELLELRLNWLKELEADGEVVRTGVESGFVVANIGSRDRVVRGLKLEVFRYVKGNYFKKGMVEVVDVEPTQSVCRIVEEVDRRLQPIAIGDLLGNPVFDKRRPLIFVLAGEFKQFNKPDIAYFIRQCGSTVWDKLAPGVDYLVAGDRSEPDQDQAREFHVMAMTEAQLVRYLQTTFPKKAPEAQPAAKPAVEKPAAEKPAEAAAPAP